MSGITSMHPFTAEPVAFTTAVSLFHVLEILPVRASPMTFPSSSSSLTMILPRLLLVLRAKTEKSYFSPALTGIPSKPSLTSPCPFSLMSKTA